MATGAAGLEHGTRWGRLRHLVSTPPAPLTLLDACAVVNLYATRRMEHILATIDGPVAVVDVVEREAQYVFRGGEGEDAKEREPIDLQPCIGRGVLAVIETTDEEELLTYIDLSQELDDGEAMTAALAIHRGYTVVTDDRKAARVLAGQTVTLRTTLDLVRAWADHQAVSAEVLGVVLTDLRERGNYYPARSHPLRSWWDTALSLA